MSAEELTNLIRSFGYTTHGQSQEIANAIAQASPAPVPDEQAGEPDVADIIAGALQTSRAHAYELMLAACAAQREKVVGCGPCQEGKACVYVQTDTGKACK